MSEWRNYEAWARSQAENYQEELERLRTAVTTRLADETEQLLSFYVRDIE